jgi:ParB family chromosome partitioning protein
MPPPRKTTPLAARITREAIFGLSADLPRLFEVTLAALRPNPDQPRQTFHADALRELADSIAQRGLIQPIVVAPDPDQPRECYIIVAGERRFRAFQLLGRETIPALLTTGDPTEITVIENVQREDLQPLEEAYAYTHLMAKYGYTQEEVATIVGKGRRTINELIGLTALPQQIQDECRTSGIPKSTLIEIARMKRPEEQLTAWMAAQHGRMTVRAARAQKKGTPAARPLRDPGQQALEAGQSLVKALKHLVEAERITDTGLLRNLLGVQEEMNSLLQTLLVQAGQGWKDLFL